MDHAGRGGSWHILAGHALLQVDERRIKLRKICGKFAPSLQTSQLYTRIFLHVSYGITTRDYHSTP
jgi:hypothetical protein